MVVPKARNTAVLAFFPMPSIVVDMRNRIRLSMRKRCGKIQTDPLPDIRPSNVDAVGFDKDNSFMLIEVAGDKLHFQTISRTGESVDTGVIERSKSK
jgi:hypothetical protein